MTASYVRIARYDGIVRVFIDSEEKGGGLVTLLQTVNSAALRTLSGSYHMGESPKSSSRTQSLKFKHCGSLQKATYLHKA